VDSRLRRSPPDRASAVPYGQAGENAMPFPRLAHRSAAAHKLHSTPQQHRMNLISGSSETSSRLPIFSLFLPGSCPNNRDRRTAMVRNPTPKHIGRHEIATVSLGPYTWPGLMIETSGDSSADEAVSEVDHVAGLSTASTATLRANMRLAQRDPVRPHG